MWKYLHFAVVLDGFKYFFSLIVLTCNMTFSLTSVAIIG